jgi:hypothetical protein
VDDITDAAAGKPIMVIGHTVITTAIITAIITKATADIQADMKVILAANTTMITGNL